ncbi:hypothetical protein [Caudoviricetes sp.]|nr:hypothetical protein [Caudoviricetes sp.]UOF79680.1 hypothetical protein [Caudoviricetes sp.]UOF79846.1 hypothetical protein [Bacteriophage sp.]UOF81351.1 hypothetical protein [Caudoviricetes sp.]
MHTTTQPSLISGARTQEMTGAAQQPLELPSSARAPIVAHTQKAKGIIALQKCATLWCSNAALQEALVLPQQHALLPYVFHAVANGRDYFLRPCPMVPRHGFVESTILGAEVRHTGARAYMASRWQLARAHDPQAEMIVMPYVNAQYSAVVTPQGVSLGLETYGATGSLGFFLPSYGNLWRDSASLLAEAGITQTPYAELLYTEHPQPQIVQLRDGPPVPTVNAYVPTHMVGQVPTWAFVALPSLSLISLHETLQEMKAKSPNGVVRGPAESMGSHIAAQVIAAGLAYIPGDHSYWSKATCENLLPLPQTGGDLPPDALWYFGGCLAHAESRRFPLHNVHSWGFDIRASNLIAYLHHVASTCLAILHSATAWDLTGSQAKILASAISDFLRLYGLAIVGESRHGKVTAAAPKRMRTPPLKLPFLTKEQKGRAKYQIHSVGRNLREYRHLSPTIAAWMANARFSSAFGGALWLTATVAWQDALAKYTAMQNSPTNGNYRSLLAACHGLINLAHNNGHVFDKFVTKATMDRIAHTPLYYLVQPESARWLLLVVHRNHAALGPRANGGDNDAM